MRGKFARCRIARPERVSGFNIYQAELNSQQYVLIIRIVRSQIAVIVVRHGARVVHGHVESFNDPRNPLGTGHFTGRRVGRYGAYNKRKHKSQREQKHNESFSHLHSQIPPASFSNLAHHPSQYFA